MPGCDFSVHKIKSFQYIAPMIDHVEFPVSDLNVSRAFYEKALDPDKHNVETVHDTW